MPSDKLIDFLYDDNVKNADPLLAELIEREDERQARQIILIPSESICAWPVRRVLDSSFTNLYAEGYPARENTYMGIDDLGDIPARLAHYRRYGDRRFYKGNAYVNLIESICRRRAAMCFATAKTPHERILANVQPLSGAAANLAVYEAFVPLGETVMALELMEGGHLSHGSPFHMTGKRYHIVSYGVDPTTELLDYDAIMALAKKARPKMIIAGYTSYPWAPDFAKFRAIADEVGAILMADIAHPAGMAIAGAYPNPIDHCDVVTFTTHKTLMGPRGAVILTKKPAHAIKINNAVFPGEQGGPHMNNIAALAVAFQLALTEPFKRLQYNIVANAAAMADEFKLLGGVRLAYGGTNTHKMLVDLKPLAKSGKPLLYGEPAAQILELCGIILNKNTIPGDTATAFATGLRLGTPWLTQRGAGEAEVREVARFIHRVVTSIEPFHYDGIGRLLARGKIDPRVLREVSEGVEALCAKLAVAPAQRSGYPHFPYLDGAPGGALAKVIGPGADAFVNEAFVAPLGEMAPGAIIKTLALDGEGVVLDEVAATRLPVKGNPAREGFLLKFNAANGKELLTWLRGLADGFTLFDPADAMAKIEGGVVIEQTEPDCAFTREWLATLPDTDAKLAGRSAADLPGLDLARPYFIGQSALGKTAPAKPAFEWQPAAATHKRTTLYDIHREAGGKLVEFAGYDMPVRYTSTIEEHNAVRQAAGLFDVSHMCTIEVKGPRAVTFLDLVCANHIAGMAIGDSIYTHFFDHEANLLDDLLVYRLEAERFLMVVNAGNEDKDWAWLQAVNEGRVLLDAEVPVRAIGEPVPLRNLKEAKWGDERLVNLALQGPKSRDILLKLVDEKDKAALQKLARTRCGYATVAGLKTVVSRTGYTGESFGYEIFVHPDKAPELWRAIVAAGAEFGVKAIGLGARDSLRIEAGLPLYGHELAGPYDLTPAVAGFGGYVKLHKGFFVGKAAYVRKAADRSMTVIRFKVPAKGSRPLKMGDPIVDERGACVGYVTSCATDGEGRLVGQALIQVKHAENKTMQVLPRPADGKAAVAAADLTVGKRVTMPVDAEIVSRFMKS